MRELETIGLCQLFHYNRIIITFTTMACELCGLPGHILHDLTGLYVLFNTLVFNEEQPYDYSISGRMGWALLQARVTPWG